MALKFLKRYQENAVEELLDFSKKLLAKDREKQTLVFQSPTGSGKTFMMSAYIEQLIEELPDNDLCFLWISIGKGELHRQSYESLKKSFSGFPDVYLLEEEFFGSRQTIDKNEVVVVNWDKLNQKDKKTGEWKSTLMKDKETVNFRELVKNTRQSGAKIILIIDESHTSASSARALEIRDEIIMADLSIEVSATPALREGDYQKKVAVDPLDVIEEGMIKKEIIVNDHIDISGGDEITSQELILQSAYSKRETLTRSYENENIRVNPLVLVQLPAGAEGAGKQEFVENYLAKKNISVANGKLAIWLSEEKINLEVLNNNTNEVEFLIFKQAISTGWDCPRAQILVRFREVKSIVFNIQVVGRILRMPEAKHYQDDALNKAYVYVNTSEFDVASEKEKQFNIIKSLKSTRKTIYTPLHLKSYYRNRIDFGDISRSFNSVLEKKFCDYFGLEIGNYDLVGSNQAHVRDKINLEVLNAKDEIMRDKSIDTAIIDYLDDYTIKSNETIAANLSENDVIFAVDNLIKRNLNGYAFKRSLSPVRNALYRWFDKYLGIDKFAPAGVIRIYLIILKNHEIFSELLDRSVKAYKPTKDEEVEQKVQEVEMWDENWEITEEKRFNPNVYTRYQYNKCLYDPCYLSFDCEVEKKFVDYLDQNFEKILWWWQNGSEHMAINFGIKYGLKSTFQPDFLVMFQDGRLGIFDTKASGEREEDNKLKSEALQEYILEENKKGKQLVGGLVIKEGAHFRINRQKCYRSFLEEESDWEYFREI